MPISYDKWDRLEVSDDSDVEVHPNVDTKSFIRAKQRQIHEQRAQRKHEIETLKYERLINDGLLERINALLDSLKKHQEEASKKNPEQLVFQSLIESAGDPAKDEPPKPPEGVYTNQKEQPRYSKMMSALVDQVKKEVDEKKSEDRYKDFLVGVNGHLTKVQKLQQDLLQRLALLEKEATAKITSDDIRDGFNSSHVNKAKPSPPAASSKPKEKPKEKPRSVELLNKPTGLSSSARDALASADTAVSSGAEADVEDDSLLKKHEGDEDEDEDSLDEASIKLTPEGKKFAQIKMGDYRGALQFISDHPDLVNEKTQDGLMVEAFNAQMKGQDEYARQCVHHSLVIQYSRQLGRDGIALFFKRITTKGHQAQQVFTKDLNETYGRIKTRAAELNKEQGQDPAGVEQIQLHAVEPGTEIHINVPQTDSEDPAEQAAREIYDRFPPGLQRALESGSLDEVNKVLGKMSVDEAEEIVELLGQGGMLSLQEGVIDATNEEGQQRLKQIEEEERLRKEGKLKEVEEAEEVGEPGDAVPIR